jgi:hypothetical protein
MARRLLPWLLPATAAAVVAPLWRAADGDGRLFAVAGKTLLSAHTLHAFSDPGVQAGPLQLLFYGSVGRSPLAAAIVLGVVAALLLVATARAVGVSDSFTLTAVGLAGVAVGLTRGVYEAGHPADGLLPLLWIVAGAEARRGRTVRAGLIIGASAGFETWGLLGIAVLALAPRSAAIAVATTAALFAPFVLGGHFASSHYVWTVSPQSLVLGRIAPGAAFGWPLRLMQAVAALTVGSSAALQLRRSAHGLWLVPVVVICVRLLIDPLDTDYYFLGLASCTLVGAGLLLQLWRRERRIVPPWHPSTTSRASLWSSAGRPSTGSNG